MKKLTLHFLFLTLVVSCKKNTNSPQAISSTEETTATELLYYISGEGPVAVNSFGQIFKYDGKTEMQITDGAKLYSDCAIKGSKIVCFRAFNNDISKKELVVMNSDGSNETVIMPFNNSIQWTNMRSPKWLTYDKIILISSGRIATIKSDGTDPKYISKILYSGPGAYLYDYSFPEISPDGKKISYIKRPVGDTEIVVIDNISQKVLTNTELYVASITVGFDSLYNEKRLTNNGYNLREMYSSWSPDGKRLVYCQAPENYNTSKIYSCDVNGNNVKLLLNDGNDNSFTRWSSDGKRIYFQAYNFTSLNGSICSCNAIDGYGTTLILKGNTTKQYKNFCNVKFN